MIFTKVKSNDAIYRFYVVTFFKSAHNLNKKKGKILRTKFLIDVYSDIDIYDDVLDTCVVLYLVTMPNIAYVYFKYLHS